MTKPPASGLIVPVPAADAVLPEIRTRFGVPWPDGLPSHVTVLYPFVPAAEVDDALAERLAAVVSGIPAFGFAMREIGRFAPNVLYLRPEPAEPFVALIEAATRAGPRSPPYEGQFRDVMPHLTVADGRTAANPELPAAVEVVLPIETAANELWLIGESAGGWE